MIYDSNSIEIIINVEPNKEIKRYSQRMVYFSHEYRGLPVASPNSLTNLFSSRLFCKRSFISTENCFPSANPKS